MSNLYIISCILITHTILQPKNIYNVNFIIVNTTNLIAKKSSYTQSYDDKLQTTKILLMDELDKKSNHTKISKQ